MVLKLTDEIKLNLGNQFLTDFFNDKKLIFDFRKFYKSKKETTLYIDIFTATTKSDTYMDIIIGTEKLSNKLKEYESFKKVSHHKYSYQLVDVTEYIFTVYDENIKYDIMLTEIEFNFNKEYNNFINLLTNELKNNKIYVDKDVIHNVIEKKPEIYLFYVIIKNLFYDSSDLDIENELKDKYIFSNFAILFQ